MPLITILWLFALIAVAGGLLLEVIAFGRIALRRFCPPPLSANRAERWMLGASIAAAILGSVGLFVSPAYAKLTSGMTIASSGAIAHSVTEISRTFYEVNGPHVIPLFTLPVAIALLPLGFFRSRTRPVIEGFCAFLLGGQSMIGMTGYGLFYAPSGVILLLAGILALKVHETNNE